MLRDRPRRRRPHHRPAGRVRVLARLPPAVLGRPAARLAVPAPAHAGDHASAASPPTRTTTRWRSAPTSGATPGDGEPVDLPPHRRPPATSPTARTPATSRWSTGRMIDYFDGPVIDVPRRRAAPRGGPRAVAARVLYWLQTEAPRPDGGTGFPGLRLRGDVTGGAGRPGAGAVHPGVAPHPRRVHGRRAGPVARRARRQGRRALPPTRSASACTASTCIPSTGGDNYIDVALLPVRDPARRAHPAADREPAARRQEHRHHPHHQRLLPPAPGRVEHRRGRRRARRLLPRPRQPRRARSATMPGLLADFQAASPRQGVELRWPDIAGY